MKAFADLYAALDETNKTSEKVAALSRYFASAGAADAAWATSDTLHVAAAVLGSRILRQAADAYDRAARSPYGRVPQPTLAGNQLEHAVYEEKRVAVREELANLLDVHGHLPSSESGSRPLRAASGRP